MTGNPDNDVLIKTLDHKEEIIEKVKNYFKIKDKKIVTIFLTKFYDRKDAANYEITNKMLLRDLLRYKEEIHVVAKVHPKTNKEDYLHYEKLFKCSVIDEETGLNNDELIVSSEIYMSVGSTTGLFAYALGIPVITYNFGLFTTEVFYRISGSLHCTTLEELSKAVDELLNRDSKVRKETIEKGNRAAQKYMKIDGKCYQRIFELIK